MITTSWQVDNAALLQNDTLTKTAIMIQACAIRTCLIELGARGAPYPVLFSD
jgi:hypothetical protein